MRRSRLSTDETGSASLEFVALGVLLLVPMVYLMVTMAAIQAGAFAVEGAARQAARVFVQEREIADARAAATRAVAFALADHGIDPDSAQVTVACTPQPDRCLARRGFVTVTVDTAVSLPLAPLALAAVFPLEVALQATATQQVSRFAGSG